MINKLKNFFKNKIINSEHNHQLLKFQKDIEKWLKKYNIQSYELIPDKEYGYVVNVDGDVHLIDKNLNSINVKFNIINGCFDCSYNQLVSLFGCPNIIYGDFLCSNNQLISLNNSPQIINGDFFCNNNELKSLEHCPQTIHQNFNCAYNSLTSLIGIPKTINGWFDCSNNKLNNLIHFPIVINGINLQYNDLSIESLINLPKELTNNYISLFDNAKLGDLPKIKNVNEIKNISHIYNEKIKLNKLFENNDNLLTHQNKIIKI